MKSVSKIRKIAPRRQIHTVAYFLIGAGLVAAMIRTWSLPNEVDYDTKPTDVASIPTAPFYNEADEANKRGYAWARAQGIVSHERCKTDASRGESSGCSKYVTEQKHIPPTPTTTDLLVSATAADCVLVVHAYYDPLFQDMRERGDHHAVSLWMRKRMGPDLQTCRQIDISRYLRVIHEPLERLTAMIDRVQRGQTLSQDDVDSLRFDYVGVQGYMADARRDRYLELAEQLFKISGGKTRFVPDTPVMDEKNRATCDDLLTKIDSLKRAFHQADAHVVRSDIAESVSPSTHALGSADQEQSRIMNEWSTLAAQGKALGCPK